MLISGSQQPDDTLTTLGQSSATQKPTTAEPVTATEKPLTTVATLLTTKRITTMALLTTIAKSAATTASSTGDNEEGTPDGTLPCQGQDGLFPDPADCSSYYQCYGGAGQYNVRHTCSSGLVFNPKQSYCDWPYNYDCATSSNPDPTERLTTAVPVTTPRSSSTTATEKSSTSVASGVTDKIFSCDGQDGLFSDPNDCSSYYQCWGGGKFYSRNTCTAGLVFNPNRQYCDWPANYACP